uniref:Groucho/TLE N-terminal Q-rich domain-containing protein n=1 Tax=Chrysemys picta bellii TaxID=8478 RepID=A0A8C3FVB8_CHRPI
MYYEMSYGLNIEMHKQTEIAKRLNVICAQLIPFLSQEHQQQVVQAVERAKQVTMAELNAAIGVCGPSHAAGHSVYRPSRGLTRSPAPPGPWGGALGLSEAGSMSPSSGLFRHRGVPLPQLGASERGLSYFSRSGCCLGPRLMPDFYPIMSSVGGWGRGALH